MLPRPLDRQLPRAHACEQRRVDVLQVQVRDPAARRPRELDRVAAADDGVARVEGELHERRIGRLEQRRDLVGALDVGRGVRMERRGDAAVGGAPSGALDPLGRAAEVVALQRGLARRLRPARPRRDGSRSRPPRARPARGRPCRRGSRPSGRGSRDPPRTPRRRRSAAARRRRPARGRTARAPPRPPPASLPKYPGGPSSIPVYPRPRTASSIRSGGIRSSRSTVRSQTPHVHGALASLTGTSARRGAPSSYSARTSSTSARAETSGDGHVPPALVPGHTLVAVDLDHDHGRHLLALRPLERRRAARRSYARGSPRAPSDAAFAARSSGRWGGGSPSPSSTGMPSRA